MHQRKLFLSIATAIIVSMMTAEVNYLEVGAAEPAQQAEAESEVRLSADRFEIEVDEIYQLEVESKTGEIRDDWKIEEIKFSQPDVLKVIKRNEIPDGTTVKKFVGQKEVEFEITDQTEVKPTQFFVVALKSGVVEIEVVISDATGKVIELKSISESLPKGTKASGQPDSSNVPYSSGSAASPGASSVSNNLPAAVNQNNDTRTDTDDADSGDSNPGNSDPGDSNPGNPDPGDSNPGNSDSGDSNPGNSDSGDSGSGDSGSGDSNPGNSDPGNSDPGNSGSGDSGTAEPEKPSDSEKPTSPSEPEKPPVNQEDDGIEAWLDQDSTSLTYNGEIQKPTFSKLPAGYTIEGLTGNTDAGTYTEEIVVKDSNGKIVNTAMVSYVICPSVIEIKHLYNAEDGAVFTYISGLAESDVVNIEGAETTDVSKAGRYQIATNIEISKEKIDNYILADGQTVVGKTDAYNVVGNNPWFEVLMDYSISEDNSQLTVNFYLKNLRTEQAGTNAERLFILDLCIYYDEELLTYDEYSQYNDWRVDTVNPDGHKHTYPPDMSSGPISVAPDLTVSYTGRCHALAGNGTTTKMCSLTYNIKDGNIEALTNSVITIDQVNYDAFFSLTNPMEENDIPARYWADPTSIVINPDGTIEEHDIVAEIDPLENNLTPHQAVCSPADFEDIKSELRDYMDVNMTETKDLTPSDPLPSDNTAIETTDEPAADTEFTEIPDDEFTDKIPAEEISTESVRESTADTLKGIENAEAAKDCETDEVNEDSKGGNTMASESTVGETVTE